jgi:hypothetical protein
LVFQQNTTYDVFEAKQRFICNLVFFINIIDLTCFSNFFVQIINGFCLNHIIIFTFSYNDVFRLRLQIANFIRLLQIFGQLVEKIKIMPCQMMIDKKKTIEPKKKSQLFFSIS